NWFDGYGAGATTPLDQAGHGSHTMGTIIGTSPNAAYGNIGVARAAMWMTVRVCGLNGSNSCDTNAILAGFHWTLAPTRLHGTQPSPAVRPHISNNSWGSTVCTDATFRTGVQNWVNAGIFPDFSNGNSGPGAGTVGSPASFPESWGTGALDTSVANWV